ncbi:MAG: hypothetical protein Q8R28_08520 [Dehalococcoidia bacterium]|nr:hypothetical protein [Dehalococcoidia bacterium]
MEENSLSVNNHRQADQRSRASRKALIVAVQVVLGLAVVVAVTVGIWDQAQNPPDSQGAMGAVSSAAYSSIPAQIAGLQRGATMTGSQAMADLEQLHGKDVGLSSGWIAHYGKDAVIYVGEAKDDAGASQLFQAMTSRIGAGNQYFKNLQQLEISGKQVYTVTGQGQRHYYYQQGREVIWVAAPSGQEEQFLQEALLAIK